MREINGRTVESDLVDDLFPSRWSPRSFGEKRIGDDLLLAVIEAARWAPSSRNEQPWRFVYAARDDPQWPSFLALLTESNREWAHRSSYLIVLIGTADRALSAFDCGAAWMSLALQARIMNLATHPMGGFDKDAARTTIGIPEGFLPLIMIAIGEHGSIESLPEHRQADETIRSQRKPIEEIAARGAFPERWI